MNAAKITQMPTPVKIQKVIGNKVTGILLQSTVDFHGTMAPGRPIYFDAKQTKVKNLPLQNVHEHQVNYLIAQQRLGAICFLVVDFVTENKFYVLPLSVFIDYWHQSNNGGRKSIPLDVFQEHGFQIPTHLGYLDYLLPVAQVLSKGEWV